MAGALRVGSNNQWLDLSFVMDAALAAARAGLPVRLYTPSEVKAAVTGSGRADKDQVTMMITRVLGLTAAPHGTVTAAVEDVHHAVHFGIAVDVDASGGDAPGMNAAIRSIVRTAAAHGHETVAEITGTAGRLTIGAGARLNRVDIADEHGVRYLRVPVRLKEGANPQSIC